LLELKGIEGKYGAVQVLYDISLKVTEGQILAIIGSNGAGKSTLINTVSGLMLPTAGRVMFEGNDITGMPPHQIIERGLSQVPEGRQIFALMSVQENLLVGAAGNRAKSDR